MSYTPGKVKCPWSACQCTHTDGCSAGWIDITLPPTENRPEPKEAAKPCGQCRPDLAAELRRLHFAPGDDTADVRRLDRPIAGMRIHSAREAS